MRPVFKNCISDRNSELLEEEVFIGRMPWKFSLVGIFMLNMYFVVYGGVIQ